MRAFPALAYPHKPGMAGFLNDWTLDLAARTPGLRALGDLLPRAGRRRVRPVAALDRGARIFKAHLQVGGYDPNDPLLDPVWGALAEAGTPVVVHCGNGPVPGAHTGVEPIGAVLRRHPRLAAGGRARRLPDYLEFAALADRYPRVHLDTTMVGTAVHRGSWRRCRPSCRSRLRRPGDRVVLGTDFPNIPYPYRTQLDALAGARPRRRLAARGAAGTTGSGCSGSGRGSVSGSG